MAEATLTTLLETVDGIQVVRIAGPIDSVTHDEFKTFLEPLVNQKRARIVLDCTGVTYINSKGLALIGRCQRLILQNLSFMAVAGLNKRITKTIELLGLSRVVKLYPSVPDAMAAAAAI
ncbi:MAG: STAS domain-containing protein [Kiritimatiellae bacterium]|nr:STAS domain-containing protein [Kiritimatiellia bacterium]